MPSLLFVFFVAFVADHSHAQEPGQEKLFATGTTMGVVTWNVTAYGNSGGQKELEQAITQELESVNQHMSTYIAESDVSVFNRAQATDWIPVSKDTAIVVHRALDISRASEGAFDITVKPLVGSWNFGKARQETSEPDKTNPDSEMAGIPDDQQIQQLLTQVGYQKLEVRLDPPALKKSHAKLEIDLSAIAKGYAVDRVFRRLLDLGFASLLVEVGGEVRASGKKPDGSDWRVGIEKPVEGERKPFRVVQLNDQALASSGDYRNFYEFQGKRYSHTIDPRTGYPVQHDVAGASVIADDCMTADAVATALMVLGPEKGLSVAKALNVEALLIRRQGNDLTTTQTEAFPGSRAGNRPENSIFRMIAIASVFFLFAVIAMAIGVIFGRDRIKGSCGGIAALDNPDIKPECSLCSRAAECEDLKKEMRKRETGPS